MTRDYMMDDIASNMPAPEKVAAGTLVKPWSPSDYPFTKEQALEVLRHAANTGFYIERIMAAYIHHCLTIGIQSSVVMKLCYGSHLHGWAYLAVDGWHGGYDSREAAYEAWKVAV